jgi:DNA-binding beta-propeller fold protein YncE
MLRARAAVLAALALVGAGCSAQSTAASAPAPGGTASRPAVTPAGLVSHALPGCTAAVQRARALPAAGTSMAAVPMEPFGVVTAGRWAFASLTGPRTIGVFRAGASPRPALIRQVPVRAAGLLGEAITPGGRYLLVADGGSGAAVLSVPALEQGGRHPLVGTLAAPAGARNPGAIEVAVSPDGDFAFVSMEHGFVLAVFNLRRALSAGFGASDYVGSIPAQPGPVGLAFSPDGRWLYSTSEESAAGGPAGALTVISVPRAETDPAASVVSRAPAGCNPVRVISSADGRVLWVTARASDALLAFSAARLRTDPAHALLADVRVGELPVGLALVRGGTRIVVADSNRFIVAGASAGLAVVDVPDALAGRPALLGYLPSGGFPREMAVAGGGRTLLVTNFASSQLESVDVAGLP